jgi:Protein of unknown function (DUF3551)
MIVITSTMFEGAGALVAGTHLCCGADKSANSKRPTKMNAFAKLIAPAAALMAVASFGALTTSTATAGEFCRQDVTGHMTSCGFSSMEQCQAASAGIGGDCFRDPKLAATPTGNQTSNHNALAYQPNVRVKHPRTQATGQ